MERRQDGKPIEFSIEFCKKSTGELVTYDRANSTISKYISNEATTTLNQSYNERL